MIYNRKGLSDVITTVLIILVVLAAVALIAGFVLNQVGTSTTAANSQAQCIQAGLQVTGCTKGTIANAGVNTTFYQLAVVPGNSLVNVSMSNAAGTKVSNTVSAQSSGSVAVTVPTTFTAFGAVTTTQVELIVKDQNGNNFACGRQPVSGYTCS